MIFERVRMRNFLAKNYFVIIAFIIPFGIFLLTTFIEPRPYYLSPIDVEHGYYYGSRLLFFGTPVVDITHPGTPVQYLGKYFFYITGTDFSQTQKFLNMGYFIIALCNGLAMSFFAAKVLRGIPSGIAFLALATVFSNPSVLTTSNIYGADAFLLAFP